MPPKIGVQVESVHDEDRELRRVSRSYPGFSTISEAIASGEEEILRRRVALRQKPFTASQVRLSQPPTKK